MPNKEQMGNYVKSRKIAGLAVIVWGANMFINWCFGFRESNPDIATAVNLSFYYCGANLFGWSLISLLDHKYITKKRVRTDVIKIVTYSVYIWSTLIIFYKPTSSILLKVSAVYFFIDIAMLCKRFFVSYSKAKKQAEEYYFSEEINTFIQWLNNCTYCMVISGLIGSVITFAPKWVITIYMFVGILVFIYIFISYQNYLMYYEYVDAAIVEEEIVPEDDLLNVDKTLKDRVDIWIENKGYLVNEINIEELSKEFATNRTYLSKYINETYKYNFRQFISFLRIEEAKRLLKHNTEKNILEISVEVGFSTSSHFSRTFKNVVGETPREWKEKNVS